ncbi:MAG: hypothetical protein M1524_04410 [Patescibacteria group bacterium]|nr:hypothetical protein [Patescibacteria group bacterium]
MKNLPNKIKKYEDKKEIDLYLKQKAVNDYTVRVGKMLRGVIMGEKI